LLAQPPRAVPARDRLSWSSCSREHYLRRVPRSTHPGREAGAGRVRVAKPPPVPSSGFLPLSTVLASSRLARSLLGSAVRRGPRRFAALFHAARVPGASLQSFPFPGSRTRSRGPSCSLAGSRSTAAGAVSAGASRSLSPVEPALCRSNPPGGGSVTHEPGRRFPAIVSPVASTRSESEPHVPSSSYRHWARRLAAGTPASKLCSPRESVLRRPLRLARLRPPVGALLGFLSSRALSTTVQGSVSRVDARREPKPHATCTSGRPAVAVAFRDPDSDAWVREPRIRRHAESIELRASPSSDDPAHPAPRERRARQSPAPLTPSRTRSRSVLLVPPLGGTPRLPALHVRIPREGAARWTSKTLLRRTVNHSHPSRGGEANTSLAERAPVPRFRVDRDAGWLAPVRTTLWARPSRGSSLWWAHLLPGGPALLDFRPSSTRLDGASDRQRSARTPFGPRSYERFAAGETPPLPGTPGAHSPRLSP
jgi:hypothetical protein